MSKYEQMYEETVFHGQLEALRDDLVDRLRSQPELVFVAHFNRNLANLGMARTEKIAKHCYINAMAIADAQLEEMALLRPVRGLPC